MKKRQLLILYLASLLFFLYLSCQQKTPGYMDAAYYFTTGQQIALGRGAIEPYLWNYLSNPQTIPNPAFSYWMPLASLLACAGMRLFGSTSFFAAKIPFLLLSASIPVMTVALVSKFTSHKLYLFLAAIFSLACGSYLSHLTISETFVPYFVLGGAFFLLAYRLLNEVERAGSPWNFLLLGIIIGLMHLTRADGILWVVGGSAVAWYATGKQPGRARSVLAKLLLLAAGYLLVMSGWFVRNLILFGSFFPHGSNLAVWFTGYDDLFMYPASELTFRHLLDSGIGEILKVRGKTALYNLENLIGVAGNIVLAPFMVVGYWRSRKSSLTRIALIMTVLLFCLMSFVFPYAGNRGGFFHSMSALQVYFWVMAIMGIEAAVGWSVKRLRWVEDKARVLFAVSLTLGIVAVTLISYFQKVQSPIDTQSIWDEKYLALTQFDEKLSNLNGGSDYIIMINDSPGYYASTGRAAIQLTSGSFASAIELMQKFNISYLVVSEDVPENLESLYLEPGDQHGLRLLTRIDDFYVYELP